MRDANPQPGGTQYDGFRYHGSDGEAERYKEFVGRDVPQAPYQYQGVTLEEEARNGGWLPNARPTGPDPIDLFTVGMRGEPGFDDDPTFNGDGRVSHGSPSDGDISDTD